jgi:energy-coupling factor transporter ATP-binding protein EcfA2
MHIQKVHLKNIRSFENLEIDFGNSGAGWHVILGTNGTGKSTLIRSIALALVGSPDAAVLGYKQSWKSWLRQGFDTGKIEVNLELLPSDPLLINFGTDIEGGIKASIPYNLFSAAYGSLRRLSGGNSDYKNIWENYPKLAAHLSVFGEDIALDQSVDWLEDLAMDNVNVLMLEKGNKNHVSWIPSVIIDFLNTSKLLPSEIRISLEPFVGIRFIDKSGLELRITELSDGYRSILSLVLELFRQLFRFHDNDKTKILNSDKTKIITEGFVLIDEIDAHLHPTWQAKIGKWFTEYFPNIQFIVTTHSPIICRSADTGTIWKLSNEGKSTQIEQIKGIEKKQLVYGNILDAFETDLFGEDISRSEESKEILKEMAVLNVKRQVGRISDTEETRLKELEQIFPIDAKDNFLDD